MSVAYQQREETTEKGQQGVSTEVNKKNSQQGMPQQEEGVPTEGVPTEGVPTTILTQHDLRYSYGRLRSLRRGPH